MGDPARLHIAAATIDVVESERLLESASITGDMLLDGLNRLAVRFSVHRGTAK